MAVSVSVSGCELRMTEGRGEGVFATRRFDVGETVMVGTIHRRLEENNPHAAQVSLTEFVLLGGLRPKVNHSCDPNCGVRSNDAGAYDLIARRAIMPGDEITFDYAMANYTIGHFPSRCGCGSQLCRGSVTGWRDLPADRKAAYQGFIASYLLEIDRKVDI